MKRITQMMCLRFKSVAPGRKVHLNPVIYGAPRPPFGTKVTIKVINLNEKRRFESKGREK